MCKRSTLLFLIAASCLWGDVTVQSHNTLKFGAALPGPVALRTQNGMESALPESTVRYRKGSREYLKSGTFACLMDYDKQTITLIDSEHKHYATVRMKDYVDRLAAALPGLPSEYRVAQEAAKVSLSSRKTGRTDKVQGIPVEETELILLLDLPAPTPSGEIRVQPMIRVNLQVWTANSPDALRVAAVRELAAHKLPDPRLSLSIDPANVLATLLGSMPGLGGGLSRMLQEVEKSGGVILKSHLAAYLPGMAGFLRQMRQEQGQALPDRVDPDAPFAVMDSEVEEISGTPVDQRLLVLPKDYHAAPFEDVVKAIAPGFPKS